MTRATNDGQDGQRLKAWRESLPRARKSAIATRSLSDVLGWEGARWWWLERAAEWTLHQREDVAAGVRAIVARLDVPAATAEACVAHVLDGAPAPKLGPWREGQCPAKPRGRPARPRVIPPEDDEDDPTPPPHGAGGPSAASPRLMRSVVAILRTREAGHLDEEEAAAALIDVIRAGWNKSMLSPRGTAAA